MSIDEIAFFDNRPNEFEMYETILDRLLYLIDIYLPVYLLRV